MRGERNQGPRPTFGENERSLEAHLFDVDADLYGQELKLSWISRLRDVMEFPSGEALKRQLDKDFAAARLALTRCQLDKDFAAARLALTRSGSFSRH
jgi:riboflavin kinase/FMN adenylyltransferase